MALGILARLIGWGSAGPVPHSRRQGWAPPPDPDAPTRSEKAAMIRAAYPPGTHGRRRALRRLSKCLAKR